MPSLLVLLLTLLLELLLLLLRLFHEHMMLLRLLMTFEIFRTWSCDSLFLRLVCLEIMLAISILFHTIQKQVHNL